MKSSLKYFVFLFILILAACNTKKNSSEESVSSTNATVSVDSQDTISQMTFNQWTGLWDSLGINFTDTSLVRYYEFPIIDMQEFLGTNATKAYFYHGLKPLGNGKYEAHLILTGNDSRGNNINKFYDVTVPCPPKCPR